MKNTIRILGIFNLTILFASCSSGDGFPTRIISTGLVFDNKMWVIGGGINGGGYSNDVRSSPDGKTWKQARKYDWYRFEDPESGPHGGFNPRSSHSSVVFNNKMWVIGGWGIADGMFIGQVDSDTDFNDVWFSSDGTTWSQTSTNAGFSARVGHTSVVFNNKIWVIGGCTDVEMYNDVWSSSDGTTWEQIKPNDSNGFPAMCGHTSVVFNNKMWVISVNNFNKQDNDIWSSSDGLNWKQANLVDALLRRHRR